MDGRTIDAHLYSELLGRTYIIAGQKYLPLVKEIELFCCMTTQDFVALERPGITFQNVEEIEPMHSPRINSKHNSDY